MLAAISTCCAVSSLRSVTMKVAKSENESLNLHGPYGAPYDKDTRYPQIRKMGVALQWGGGRFFDK